MLSRRCALAGLLGALVTTASEAATELAAAKGGPIVLAAEATQVALRPTGGVNIAAALSQTQSRRFSLLLRGLAASRPPEAGYLVFFNVPAGATPGMDDPGLAGTISFFGAPASAEGSARNVSFEVSGVLRRLRLAGRLGDALSVTFVPTGKPAPDSRPTINQIALMEQ